MRHPSADRRSIRSVIENWLGGRVVSQLLLLFGVLWLFGALGANTLDNMRQYGITPGFAFSVAPREFRDRRIPDCLLPRAILMHAPSWSGCSTRSKSPLPDA